VTVYERKPAYFERTLALASYNIHRCFGTDRKYLPERIVQVIRALDSDIVGLQEVDIHLLVDGRPQLDYLAESLGMEAVAGPNFQDHQGHFGNAILTRLPVLKVRRFDLSVGRREPRGGIDALLDMEGMPVRVIVTHLGLRASERRYQVRHLMRVLENGETDIPTIVMGDFNEWKPTHGALRRLNRRFGQSLSPRTFPSRFPLLPLDRIWVWPQEGLKRAGVYATALTRVASDHLPLRAIVGWDARDLPGAWKEDIAAISNG
jgi:endonuclease/exonuclease/phosphatase family metal-dependent hydrolase